MKRGKTRRAQIAGAAVVAVSAAATQADVIVSHFDNATEVGTAPAWHFDFGGVTQSAVWDPTVDFGGDPNSGSMKITANFDTTLADNNKVAYTHDIAPALNGGDFAGLEMDVKVDPSSAMDAVGGNGFFSLVIRNGSGYDWSPQFNDSLRSSDGWRHVFVPSLQSPSDDIRALTIQLYGAGLQNLSGPVTLWIDNVNFTTAHPLPGDANDDGKVDFADLVTLARHYGKKDAIWEDGDFNDNVDSDESVGFDDLVTLARNYGQTLTPAQLATFDPSFRAAVQDAFAQVPEPSGLALISVAAGALLQGRQRRKVTDRQ